ncbi:peptide chain release factor N(5)-glutamine methyltransferase [Wolbachia endosymbiont of Atemnus politus]|uniref:peptide chain release factor N(5)-glutamine methyltransferase n=1 Tax=Wolbachia endosymbiont of Atemnus politus TaxID=2682840 RepID=UPI00157315B4|nr:peptide chain release factor N(5)-glutamine methyltransferase [Wolbachia endosymbiont of Atemnus politus]NSM56217.1 peptide chain release factor N(5)-glutamine methyltransferase [Wolbachia endosymbiont of Atemnus politus]NSX83201.1 peptide chain release factor N(5)-glutamine methyltransferase [Wolbachia endosymbiont of Atemnus politus]
MKTISALIQEGSKLLSSHKVESPYLDCEIIMQHVLGVERSSIIMNHADQVPIEKEQLFWKLMKKRVERHPISQIIGNREFWSKNFIVNQHVLDPRPDSETIIRAVLKYYPNKKQRLKVVDFGTGTGCLLISVLSEYEYAVGIGFEKSLKAYRVAYQNIKKHNLLGRAQVFPRSWTECKGLFDLIISNPPYIKRSKLKDLQAEVQKEPRIALDGGIDGLSCYLSIFPILKRCLKKNGFAILEIGEDQNNIDKIIPSYGLAFQEYVYDLAGMKRCIVVRCNSLDLI